MNTTSTFGKLYLIPLCIASNEVELNTITPYSAGILPAGTSIPVIEVIKSFSQPAG